MRDLPSNLSLGEMARPGDDGWESNASLKHAELGAAIRAAAAASEMGPFLDRMPVVGLIHNDRPFQQTRILQILHQPLYPLVQGGYKRGIKPARKRQLPVVLHPFFVPLVRVVRHVEGE